MSLIAIDVLEEIRTVALGEIGTDADAVLAGDAMM